MKTVKPLKFISVLVAMLAAVAFMSAMAAERGSDEVGRKSDLYFMEAMRRKSLGQDDAALDLLRRAYELNPTDSDVGFQAGYMQIFAANEDSLLFEQGYAQMLQHFLDEPADLYGGFMFGNISERVGRMDRARQVWATLDSIYPEKVEMAMRHGDALVATRDSAALDSALRIFDRVERAEGPNLQVASRKMAVNMLRRDTVGAMTVVNDLIAGLPRSPEARAFAGQVYASLGDSATALGYYREACAIDSLSGIAHYMLGNFYRELGDMEGFDREVFRALDQESLDLETKKEMLTGYVRELYADSLQQPRIERLFNVLIDQNPSDVELRELFFSYYLAVEDYVHAVEQVRIAVDLDPADEARWRLLVSLYGQIGDYRSAADAGAESLRYFPDSPQMLILVANCLTMLDDYDGALAYLDRAERVPELSDTERSDVLTVKGDVNYRQGNTAEAFRLYEAALEASAINLTAMNNCAYYMACEGVDLERAEKLSASVIRERPDDATSIDTYAWVLFKMTRYADAREYIDRALAAMTELSAEVLHHAGDIYFMAGLPDEALAFWRRAADLEPDNELLRRKITHKTYFYK